jgi:hypothetical protein
MLFPLPVGVQHNNHEDHETESDEDNYPRLTLPNLPHAVRKLGPIHFFNDIPWRLKNKLPTSPRFSVGASGK